MSPSSYFTKAKKTAIVDAIREAERDTSGEIRVHIERHAKKPYFEAESGADQAPEVQF